MQLKIRRSQRDGGIISKTAIFCLDARMEFTEAERTHIARYKLAGQVIYNSDASQRLQDKADRQRDGSVGGSLKSLASIALAHMKLNISIASLERGQHIECKSLDELLGAEEAIMTACQNLKGYLDTAATFDGREVLFDFATGQAEAVARVITPAPMLIEAPRTMPTQAMQTAAPVDTTVDADFDEVPPVNAATRDASLDDFGEPTYAQTGLNTQQKLICAAAFLLFVLILAKLYG